MVQTQFGILTAQTLQLCTFIGIQHRASIAGRSRLPVEADPTTPHLFTHTDLHDHMRYRPTGLNHQAGSLPPKLRGVPPALARHTDILPAGPAVPPVRYPPSGVNPTL
jgi:hypothetical protein